jgi:anti-sigma B factor antagonist
MSMLEIRQERDAEAGVEVVAPQGEVDISNLSILDQVLVDVLQRRPRRLVVDLSGVAYIDSGGVSSLLRAGQRFSRQGGQLALADGSRFVRRLLQMTGIDRIFPYFDTLPAALNAAPVPETPRHSERFAASVPGAPPDEAAKRERFQGEVDSETAGAALSAPRPTT